MIDPGSPGSKSNEGSPVPVPIRMKRFQQIWALLGLGLPRRRSCRPGRGRSAARGGNDEPAMEPSRPDHFCFTGSWRILLPYSGQNSMVTDEPIRTTYTATLFRGHAFGMEAKPTSIGDRRRTRPQRHRRGGRLPKRRGHPGGRPCPECVPRPPVPPADRRTRMPQRSSNQKEPTWRPASHRISRTLHSEKSVSEIFFDQNLFMTRGPSS